MLSTLLNPKKFTFYEDCPRLLPYGGTPLTLPPFLSPSLLQLLIPFCLN